MTIGAFLAGKELSDTVVIDSITVCFMNHNTLKLNNDSWSLAKVSPQRNDPKLKSKSRIQWLIQKTPKVFEEKMVYVYNSKVKTSRWVLV